MKIYKSTILMIIAYCMTIGIGLLKLTQINLILNLILSIILILYIKRIFGYYSNITLMFCTFHILYGLSGPVSILWGEGISEIFTQVFEIDVFLIAFDLATIGLILGINIFNNRYKEIEHKHTIKINKKNNNVKKYLIWAFVLAIITIIMEFINFVKVGGISTLAQGKALYQAAISNLTLTMPTDSVICISLALFGIYAINIDNKISLRYIIVYFIILLPYLLIKILLGQRGSLLALMLIIVLIYTYKKPLKKVSFKLVLILGIAYFFMCFLYTNRAKVSILFTEPKQFIEQAFNSEKIIKALNPASNEFGVGFANFNELYISKNYKFLMGESYIKGLVVFIPSFLYLGEKPIQITYQFRNQYFYSESLRSRIAGTGFSSILEAYWNFGFIGIIIIYIIYGYFLTKLELYYKNKNSLTTIIYLAISPFIIAFHRTALGDVISAIIIKFIVILVVYICINKKGDNFEKNN